MLKLNLVFAKYLKQSCELAPDSQPEKWLTLGELEEGKDSLCCLEKAVGEWIVYYYDYCTVIDLYS